MKQGNIGGQAVIEGAMLRSPQRQAVAVRTANGEIVTNASPLVPLARRWTVLGFPLIRGVVALYESLSGAVSSLAMSANLTDPQEQISPAQFAFVAVVSLALGIGLFFLLPVVLVNPLARWLGSSSLFINLLESIVRILLFISYLLLVGLSRDIRRTFEYHGAEHKVISCWEQDKPLTAEAAAACSRLHPRCGTSFLLLVVILSILLFSLFSPPTLWVKLVLRLALMPVLAGIAYEIIKWTAKNPSFVARALLAPGLALQKLTTREPDASQLEVALAALAGVIDPGEE